MEALANLGMGSAAHGCYSTRARRLHEEDPCRLVVGQGTLLAACVEQLATTANSR